MFRDCTNLTTAPKLYADTVENNSYHSMFYNCAKLTKIYCNARYVVTSEGIIEILDSIGTNWLLGVNDTPDCIFYKNYKWGGPVRKGINTIPSEWIVTNWFL